MAKPERRIVQPNKERGGWEVVSPAALAIVCFRREDADDAATDAAARSVPVRARSSSRISV